VRHNQPAGDARIDALASFVHTLVSTSGDVPAEVVLAVKQAGYSDAQIVDTLLAMASINFTNLFNRVNVTPLDFPPRRLTLTPQALSSASVVSLERHPVPSQQLHVEHQVFQHQLGCHGQQRQVLVFFSEILHRVGHLAQMVGDQAAQLVFVERQVGEIDRVFLFHFLHQQFQLLRRNRHAALR
jgi:hypothetical protein